MFIRGIHSTLHSSPNFSVAQILLQSPKPGSFFLDPTIPVCFSHGETTAAFSPKHLKNPKMAPSCRFAARPVHLTGSSHGIPMNGIPNKNSYMS